MKQRLLKRLLSLVVTVALLLQIVPVTTLAEDIFLEETATQIATYPITPLVLENGTVEAPIIIGEDTSRRTANTKHFRMSDGSYTAVVYEEPVHYMDSGEWKNIDNTLERKEQNGVGYYENVANAFRVRFAEHSNEDSLLSISRGEHYLSMRALFQRGVGNQLETSGLSAAEQAQISGSLDNTPNHLIVSQAQIAERNDQISPPEGLIAEWHKADIHSSVLYENVQADVDLQYEVTSTGVKENILVSSPKENYTYTFAVTSNLLLTLQEDGSIAANAGDTTVFTIPAPFMYDAAGEISHAVTYQVTAGNYADEWLLHISADSTWINAEERVFPIVIDPAVETEQTGNAIENTHVTSDSPNSTYSNYTHMYVGRAQSSSTSQSVYRAFFNIALPELTASDVPTGAMIYLAPFSRDASSTTSVTTLQLYEVPQTYTGNIEALTWNAQANWNYGTVIDSLRVPYQDPGGYHAFDITNTVKDWYAGTKTQTGFMLRAADEALMHRIFYYTDRGTTTAAYPLMVVSYRNTMGVENYWSYVDMGSGYGGSTAVNLFSGNVVSTQPLLSIGGTRAPVAPALIYNSSDSASPYSPMGNGWKTNYHVAVLPSEDTAEMGYRYFLRDADGTQHYFYFESETTMTGKDEDGLGYTMTIDSSATTTSLNRFTITDKDKNKMLFGYDGLLTEIQSADGNNVTITYETQNGAKRIATVKDGTDEPYTYIYETDSNQLIGIKDPASRTVSFGYTDGLLTACTFPESITVSYTYTDGRLTQIANPDNTKVAIAYDDSSAKRAISLTRETTANLNDISLHLTYGHNETTVTRKGYNSAGSAEASADWQTAVYQLDNYGHVIGVVDMETGMAQHTRVEPPRLLNGKVNLTAHKVTQSSATQQSILNYLKDPYFDNGTSYYSTNILSGQTATITGDTSKGHTAAGSVKISRTATGSASQLFLHQNFSVTVPAGHYTLSAYINTGGTALTSTNTSVDYGAVVRLQTSTGDVWDVSDPIVQTGANEWVRVFATVNLPEPATLRAMVGFNDATTKGTFWVDDIQLEGGRTVSSLNLLENTAFIENSNTWQGTSSHDTSVALPTTLQELGNALKVEGTSTSTRRVVTTCTDMDGEIGDVFAFGSWGKAASLPLNGIDRHLSETTEQTPKFGIELTFLFEEGTIVEGESTYYISFNSGTTDWQFITGEAIAPANYTGVQIALVYDYNANSAWFTYPYLYKENYAESYTYDDNGNVTSVTDLAEVESTFAYSNNQMSQLLNPTGSRYLYAYNDKNQLITAQTNEGQRYTFTYDENGNVTGSQTTFDDFLSSYLYIESGEQYYICNAFEIFGNCITSIRLCKRVPW